MTYVLVALGAAAFYFLVILPWLHRREESVDFKQGLRRMNAATPPPRPRPTSSLPRPAPEGTSVESVLTPGEARALLGDDEETELDDGVEELPPWPTEASHPADLEPVLSLSTGNVSLATVFLLRLQAEGIAYLESSEVWASRQIFVPRKHQADARRILEELQRDVERRSEDD